ncbi:MAG: hypothetical protein NPIRA04_30910 [Nitrospirales bacterium]|nr:MAG: hypothetical protein NPIRA04_30910 [Nitrospirales bacterium]
MINEAIEIYLEVYEWQEQHIRERLKKANKGGKFSARSEVRDLIETFKP